MPNYVYNILKISSKKDNNEEVIKFIKQHYNDKGFFDFNTFVPEPTTEEECPPEYNFNTEEGISNSRFEPSELMNPKGREWFNWYQWRLKYWGTKWNCGEESQCYFDLNKINEHCSLLRPVHIHFTTAWNAPFPIFEQIYKMHPELKIRIIYHSTENNEYGEFQDIGNCIDFYHWDLTNYTEEEIREEGVTDGS